MGSIKLRKEFDSMHRTIVFERGPKLSPHLNLNVN